MKNRLLVIGIIIVLVLTIVFTRTKYLDLKENAISFTMGEYKSDIDDTVYGSLNYNNRTYIPYGTLKGQIKTKDIKTCIGYIVQDENSSSTTNLNDKDTRVYTLANDKDENFLMVYYVGESLMNQPDFYRALDTKDKNIEIPNFIDKEDYEYWN